MMLEAARSMKNSRRVPQPDASGQTDASLAVENDTGESEFELESAAEGRDAAAGLLVGGGIGAVLWLLIYFLIS